MMAVDRHGESAAEQAAVQRAIVREAVLRYLHANPKAADAPEGILAWWLGEAGERVSLQLLEVVLADLVAAGHLQRTALADGRILYSLPHPPRRA